MTLDDEGMLTPTRLDEYAASWLKISSQEP